MWFISELKKIKKINKIYAGKNGIVGALNEEIIDISKINKSDLDNLYNTSRPWLVQFKQRY